VQRELRAALEHKRNNLEVVLVFRGAALGDLQGVPEFLELCLLVDAVVCCRCAPKDKADVVRILRGLGKTVLAIGDGGNDVGMIQAANVGVGLRGQEGLQAARASDFAISSFRFLVRLVLVHGRSATVRSALIAQYSFYKSFLFCCMQLLFNCFTFFSGSSLFNTACTMAYNAVLFVPILTFVLCRDVPTDAPISWPRLYSMSRSGWYFNFQTVCVWLLRALLQAGLLFFLTILTRDERYVDDEGGASDFESLGIIAFSSFMWVQSGTMFLDMPSVSALNIWVVWGFHFFTLFVTWLTSLFMLFNGLNGFGVASHVVGDPVFWLVTLISTVAALLPVVYCKGWQFNFHPSVPDHLNWNYSHEHHDNCVQPLLPFSDDVTAAINEDTFEFRDIKLSSSSSGRPDLAQTTLELMEDKATSGEFNAHNSSPLRAHTYSVPNDISVEEPAVANMGPALTPEHSSTKLLKRWSWAGD
jgi:magnesium-transporting ATPase (P-type)